MNLPINLINIFITLCVFIYIIYVIPELIVLVLDVTVVAVFGVVVG